MYKIKTNKLNKVGTRRKDWAKNIENCTKLDYNIICLEKENEGK